MLPIPDLRHTYASVAEFNDYFTNSGSSLLTSSTNNVRKREILEEVSRLADHKCKRGNGFGPWVGTKYYDGDSRDVLWLRGDLTGTPTAFTVTPSFGDTPVSPTISTDYYLAGIGGYNSPYRKIILHGEGTTTLFGDGPRLTAVTGTWSYPYRTALLTVTTAEDLDTSETEVDVSGLTGLSPGMTILVDSEQMYVTATTDSVTDSITVERGVNGTTAASHTTGAAITRYVYTSVVRNFTLRMAEKRWKARDAGADGTDGGNDVGTISLREGEDTIVRRMLGPVILSGQV